MAFNISVSKGRPLSWGFPGCIPIGLREFVDAVDGLGGLEFIEAITIWTVADDGTCITTLNMILCPG